MKTEIIDKEWEHCVRDTAEGIIRLTHANSEKWKNFYGLSRA